MRREMGKIGISAAESVNYVNAGTIEFLYDSKENQYYFLRDEHPSSSRASGHRNGHRR